MSGGGNRTSRSQIAHYGRRLPRELALHGLLYLGHGLALLVELGGPKGLPDADASTGGVEVRVAAQEADVPHVGVFLAAAVAVDAVQHPGNLVGHLVGPPHQGVAELGGVEGLAVLALPKGLVVLGVVGPQGGRGGEE
jgi:hypothetical protein